jgi:hypothetical protein
VNPRLTVPVCLGLCFNPPPPPAPPRPFAVGSAVAGTLGYYTLPLASLCEGEYKLILKHPHTGLTMERKDTWIKVGLHWRQPAEQAKEAGEQDGANPMYGGPSA